MSSNDLGGRVAAPTLLRDSGRGARRGASFVAGAWSDGASANVIDVWDPATERRLAAVAATTAAQVDAALAAARVAFDGGAWRATAAADRARYIHAVADALDARRADFVELLVAETGTPIRLAGALQFDMAVDILRWHAEAALGPIGSPTELPPVAGSRSTLHREPAGVVAAITAYNYPLQLLSRKLGASLASGCTLVVMPPERAPLSTVALFDVLAEADLPPGVVNLVVGDAATGVALTSDRRVDLISFTGSTAVGAQIVRQGAAAITRTVLELGGKSPTVLLPSGDVDEYVAAAVARFTANAGQGCGCTTRLVVPAACADAVAERATAVIDAMRVGDPCDPATDVGPLIRPEQRAFVESHVDAALAGGAELLAGGGRPDHPHGWYMNPALLGHVTPDDPIVRTELFGPVAVLQPYTTIDDAVALANDCDFGLHAQVWGDPHDARQVANRLRAGTVVVNGGGAPPRPDAPWGGFGLSGIGREGGDAGYAEYFELKHIQERL